MNGLRCYSISRAGFLITFSGTSPSRASFRRPGMMNMRFVKLRLLQPWPAKGRFTVAVFLPVFQLGQPLGKRGPVPLRHPPHHEMLLAHQREPFLLAGVELPVNRIPDKGLKRLD